MKILIKFQQKIGIKPYEVNISSAETVEGLQVMISLNFQQMETCKLIHKGMVLTNKQQKLTNIFKQQHAEVEVVRMSGSEQLQSDFGRNMQKIAKIIKGNDKIFAGIGVVLVMILLTWMG